MPSLTIKQRQLRALKDLETTGLVKAVKRGIADQCLNCPPQDVGQLRAQAALADQFLTTLRGLVTNGELEYNDRTK